MTVPHILFTWIALNLAIVGIPFARTLLAIARESAARQFWIKTHPAMSADRMPAAISQSLFE